MIKLLAFPLQPFNTGVTLRVELSKLCKLLVAINEGILPLPEEPSPMVLLLLVQLKLAPGGVLENKMAALASPAQSN